MNDLIEFPRYQYQKKKVVFHCLATNRYYVNSFIDYLLPTLLHKDSLWFLKKFEVTLLVSTSIPESKIILNSPLLRELGESIRTVFHFLDEKTTNSNSKYRISKIMSESHYFAVQFSLMNRTYTSFLSPDMMVNSKFLNVIETSINENVRVCLSPALRMTYLEPLLEELQRWIASPGCLSNRGIPSHILVKACLNNLHAETSSFFYNSSSFLQYQQFNTPTALLFESNENNQILGFGMSWFLVVLNFSDVSIELMSKCLRTLQEHTIDAYFLNDFLGAAPRSKVEFKLDSHEIFVCSWDRITTRQESQKGVYIDLTDEMKHRLVMQGCLSGIYDDFKLNNFRRPWVLNPSSDVSSFEISDYKVPGSIATYLTDIAKGSRHFFYLNFLANHIRLKTLIREYRRNQSEKDLIISSNASEISKKNSAIKRIVIKLRNREKLESEVLIHYAKNRINKYRSILISFFFWLYFLASFKKSISNPLNQAKGGRIHASTRIYFSRRTVRDLIQHP